MLLCSNTYMPLSFLSFVYIDSIFVKFRLIVSSMDFNLLGLYTIEFQKRGLPHVHILLWLDQKDKLNSPDAINSVIFAE